MGGLAQVALSLVMIVSPGLLARSALHIEHGDEFDEHDRIGSPLVALVNQTLARRIDPSGSVVGRVFVADGKSLQVVGVVKDAYLLSVADARCCLPLSFSFE